MVSTLRVSYQECPPSAVSKLRMSTNHGCMNNSFAALAVVTFTSMSTHNLQNLVVCKVLYGVGICWERLWASGYLIISSFANWKPTSINSNPNLNWTGQWDDKGGRKTSQKKIVKLVTRIWTMWESFEQNYVPQSLGALQILLNRFFSVNEGAYHLIPLSFFGTMIFFH